MKNRRRSAQYSTAKGGCCSRTFSGCDRSIDECEREGNFKLASQQLIQRVDLVCLNYAWKGRERDVLHV
jgi:hypothetical protein